MSEQLPISLSRKIEKRIAFLSAKKISNEELIKQYNTSYGKYIAAIVDCDGTVIDHYVSKEAYRCIAEIRGIEI